MKVTDIEVHQISLEYQDWIAYPVSHYEGVARRTVYAVHTDTGLIGLGESGRPEPQEVLDQYLGTNPFAWMGDETSLPLGTAMYVRGHQKIGAAIRAAGLFAAGNIPFMLQNVGGTITRAMVCHMMAAFPTATFHFLDSSEILQDDVVHERLEPVNGLIRVPEKPGLGLMLDRGELVRLAKRELPPVEPWIIKSKFANGARMYRRHA